MNILYKNSNPSINLQEYIKLYNSCFSKKKFKLDYINWLYNENPNGQYIGIDCFDNDMLIGQVGGIPIEFFWKKQKLKIIISINVCVNNNYRGQRLFSKMAEKFEMLVKKNNFDGIIAIGNKLATPAWIKSIKLINLGGLQAFLSLGEINENNIDFDYYDFYSHWDKKKLNWRLDNPEIKTFLKKDNKDLKLIYSSTKYPLIKAHAPIRCYKNNDFSGNNKKIILQPFIFIGKISNLKNKSIFNIPKFLRPSPLNFLYKLFDSNISLEKEKIFFTFMDFDIF
jgi:hypothetical protein